MVSQECALQVRRENLYASGYSAKIYFFFIQYIGGTPIC